MNPPRLGIHQPGQRLYIRTPKLFEHAELEHFSGEFVFPRQLFEHVDIRRISRFRAPHGRQSELGEQDLLELLWRVEYERLPSQFKYLVLQRFQPAPHLFAQGAEEVCINGDAGLLHACQNANERKLYLLEQRLEIVLTQ